jgi:hypothetical protein
VHGLDRSDEVASRWSVGEHGDMNTLNMFQYLFKIQYVVAINRTKYKQSVDYFIRWCPDYEGWEIVIVLLLSVPQVCYHVFNYSITECSIINDLL